MRAWWTLELAGFLPDSMNKRERTHWRTRHRSRTATQELVAWHALAARVPAAAGRRRRVVIELVKRTAHRDDPGNLAARSKDVLDALVSLGLLVDDDDAGLELVVRQVKDAKRGPMTRILITDT